MNNAINHECEAHEDGTMADCIYNDAYICADCAIDIFFDAIITIVDPANQGIELGTDEHKTNGVDVDVDSDGNLVGFKVQYLLMEDPFEGVISLTNAEYVKNNGGM